MDDFQAVKKVNKSWSIVALVLLCLPFDNVRRVSIVEKAKTQKMKTRTKA